MLGRIGWLRRVLLHLSAALQLPKERYPQEIPGFPHESAIAEERYPRAPTSPRPPKVIRITAATIEIIDPFASNTLKERYPQLIIGFPQQSSSEMSATLTHG